MSWGIIGIKRRLKILNFSVKCRIFLPTIAKSADPVGRFFHIMPMKIASPHVPHSRGYGQWIVVAPSMFVREFIDAGQVLEDAGKGIHAWLEENVYTKLRSKR